MNTKKEIVAFLEELARGVQGKRDGLAKKLNAQIKYSALHEDFTKMYEYTEGQLYEINYILGELTRDKRKKI